MNNSNTIVRWGVMGTARIASKVGDAIGKGRNAQLLAIASRDGQRADNWSREHGAERSYDSYEALLNDDDLDAIYIPLPPSMHAEWAIKAAEHGKHVLCEKPLAVSSLQAKEMASACREHGVQLMDGVMWKHHPRAHDMQTVIQNGSLGTLKRVTSAFTFCWDDIPEDEFRLSRKLGGGSLLDLGWYCVGLTLQALGDSPRRVFGTARLRGDVDLSFSGTMWFDDEQVASFDCGFETVIRKWCEIAGTKASLICDDFTKPWQADKPRFWIHDAMGQSTEHLSECPVQEVCMIEKFSRIVQSGELEARWPQEAVATQRVCEALDQSARSGKIVEIEAL